MENPDPGDSGVWLPNGDTIHVLVGFGSGNVLAYILQRHPENGIRNDEFWFKEVQLPTGGGVYVRNLYDDFTGLFGYPPTSNISAVQFTIDVGSATGWALLDDLRIGDGSVLVGCGEVAEPEKRAGGADAVLHGQKCHLLDGAVNA